MFIDLPDSIVETKHCLDLIQPAWLKALFSTYVGIM